MCCHGRKDDTPRDVIERDILEELQEKKETEDRMANAEKEVPLVRTVETGLLA